MKRLLTASLGLFVLLGMCLPLSAQRNPRGKTKLTLEGKSVSIEYGRPSLHGRQVSELLAGLKPGQVWRLGADQSTTFSTNTDLSFGSVTVPKGAYSLWARKDSNNRWELVFNKQHGQWGTEHNPGMDLVSAPLNEEKAGNSAEMVTIALTKQGNGGQFSVEWGDLKLVNDFSVK